MGGKTARVLARGRAKRAFRLVFCVTWTYTDGLERIIREIHHRLGKIEHELESILQHVAPHRAKRLKITWDQNPRPAVRNRLFKENPDNMPQTLSPGQVLGFTVTPLDAAGNPSKATLSSLSVSSSDPAVFTVVPDPASPNTRGIATAGTPPVSPDAAVLTAIATATEPDGKTEKVQGTDTVTVITTPPPPPPAASLGITWDATSGGA